MSKSPAESDQGHDPNPPPKALRILIADDDRDAVLTLMTLLRDEGHDVRGVSCRPSASSARPAATCAARDRAGR